MADDSIPIPRPLHSHCVGCAAWRAFTPVDGDTDALVCTYECEDCGHELKLRLDP